MHVCCCKEMVDNARVDDLDLQAGGVVDAVLGAVQGAAVTVRQSGGGAALDLQALTVAAGGITGSAAEQPTWCRKAGCWPWLMQTEHEFAVYTTSAEGWRRTRSGHRRGPCRTQR